MTVDHRKAGKSEFLEYMGILSDTAMSEFNGDAKVSRINEPSVREGRLRSKMSLNAGCRFRALGDHKCCWNRNQRSSWAERS